MKEFLLYFWNMPIEEFYRCLGIALVVFAVQQFLRWWSCWTAKKRQMKGGAE